VVNAGLDDDQLKKFNQYCHFYNCLGIVGFEDTYDVPGQYLTFRRCLYLLYLVLYPLNIPFSWAFVLLASITSIALSNPRSTKQSLLMNLFEEESMNLCLVFFLGPSGRWMRVLVNICLSLWAIQHANMLAYRRLQHDPETIGLAALTPIIQTIHCHKVEMNVAKNALELLIGFLAAPSVYLSQAALIFPILYYQYMKVKYMANAYNKLLVNQCWDILEKHAPPLISALKMFGFGKALPKDKNADGTQSTVEQQGEGQPRDHKATQQNTKPKQKKKTADDQTDDEMEVLDTDDMKKIN